MPKNPPSPYAIQEIKYCKVCGSLLQEITVGISYDQHTGEKIVQKTKRCPRRILWIFPCDFMDDLIG